MEKLQDFSKRSLEDFSKELASSAPVPGGGGTCAYVGALGCALGRMVGSLTLGKKAYAESEETIMKLQSEAEELQSGLLALINKDAEGFYPLSKVYGMPRNTEEEKRIRSEKMEAALKTACQAPLEMMRLANQMLDLLTVYAERGTRLAVSDAGVGAALCEAAVYGAGLNVRINTKLMTDQSCADNINNECDALLKRARKAAAPITTEVWKLLGR